METTEPGEKKGISRRAVIVNGAIGAAAFWSVPVIESVTQRAAAASGCQGNTTYTVSYIWVVFTYENQTYFAGTTTGCGWSQGTLRVAGSTPPLCTGDCGGFVYGTNGFQGGASDGDIYFNASGSGCLTSGTPALYADASTAPTYLNCNGTQISSAQAGVEIVAYFWFTGANTYAACTDGTGNPICVNFA